MGDLARIPFNRPRIEGNEIRYMIEAIENGHISGDGDFTRRCRDYFELELGVPAALLTTSCTSALEMMPLLLDIGPGDEVIVPAFTFVSTVNAFVLRGATPIFADIRPDTLNVDEARLSDLFTPNTKAVVVVHYAGVGCEMDSIVDQAQQRGVAVFEDNAHGLFGRYRGRLLGTFGSLAALSFHETKNFGCGEGGALLINDANLVERAEIIREKGTDRTRFFRGEVDKYSWVDVGSSYLPSDLLAAVLFAQLEQRQAIMGRRHEIWQLYWDRLHSWGDAHGFRLPFVPEHCEQPHHMFYLLAPDEGLRDAMLEHLRGVGILGVFHYLPLHLSPMGLHLGGANAECPVTESVSGRLLRLPFYNGLTHDDQERVIKAVRSFPGG